MSQWSYRRDWVKNIIHHESQDFLKRTTVCTDIPASSGCRFFFFLNDELASIHGQALEAANPILIRLKTIGISPKLVHIVGRRIAVRRWEASGKTLVLCRCWKSTEGVHGNEAGWRYSNVSGSSGEW